MLYWAELGGGWWGLFVGGYLIAQYYLGEGGGDTNGPYHQYMCADGNHGGLC